MKFIDYNIGSDKSLNYKKLFLISLLTLVISGIFIKSGINNIVFLNSKTTEKQRKIDNLNKYIDSVLKNKDEINKKIRDNKIKWEPRIRFINSLIDKKTFPYLKRLDLLEKLLPDKAFLRNIQIKYGAKQRILLSVETNSFKTLLDVYKVFGKLNLKFGSETRKDGKFVNTMSLVMRDE